MRMGLKRLSEVNRSVKEVQREVVRLEIDKMREEREGEERR